VQSLEQQIHAAFFDIQLPSRPVTGHPCDECDTVDRLLGGRLWSDVAADFPPYCHDAFPLLTAEAQAYYLPAYMLVSLGPDANMQGVSLEAALENGALSPEAFSPIQRATIVCWMKRYWQLAEDSDPPPNLLERWSEL
jgi:hypothetical protein